MTCSEDFCVSGLMESYAEELVKRHLSCSEHFRKACWKIHEEKRAVGTWSSSKGRIHDMPFVFLLPVIYDSGWFGWYRCFSRTDGTDDKVRMIRKLARHTTYDEGKKVIDPPWTRKDFETLNVPYWCAQLAGEYDQQIGTRFRRMGRAAHRLMREGPDLAKLDGDLPSLSIATAIELGRNGQRIAASYRK